MGGRSERRADRVMRGMEQITPKLTPIADKMILPNYSGTKRDPIEDQELATKAYVDAAIGAPKLNDIGNPDGNKEFNMSNKLLAFRYVAPTPAGAFGGAFEIEASGGFSGNLVHIHQHSGNPGATRLVDIEYEDTDIIPIRVRNGVPAVMFQIDNSGNLTLAGTVDGIDIATDVAANTTHSGGDGSDHADVATNSTHTAGDGSDHADVASNTTHAGDSSQAHSDYLKNDAVDVGVGLTLTGDNNSADTAYVPMVLYNTDDTPPAASGFPKGTLYVQYTP